MDLCSTNVYHVANCVHLGVGVFEVELRLQLSVSFPAASGESYHTINGAARERGLKGKILKITERERSYSSRRCQGTPPLPADRSEKPLGSAENFKRVRCGRRMLTFDSKFKIEVFMREKEKANICSLKPTSAA